MADTREVSAQPQQQLTTAERVDLARRNIGDLNAAFSHPVKPGDNDIVPVISEQTKGTILHRFQFPEPSEKSPEPKDREPVDISEGAPELAVSAWRGLRNSHPNILTNFVARVKEAAPDDPDVRTGVQIGSGVVIAALREEVGPVDFDSRFSGKRGARIGGGLSARFTDRVKSILGQPKDAAVEENAVELPERTSIQAKEQPEDMDLLEEILASDPKEEVKRGRARKSSEIVSDPHLTEIVSLTERAFPGRKGEAVVIGAKIAHGALTEVAEGGKEKGKNWLSSSKPQ